MSLGRESRISEVCSQPIEKVTSRSVHKVSQCRMNFTVCPATVSDMHYIYKGAVGSCVHYDTASGCTIPAEHSLRSRGSYTFRVKEYLHTAAVSIALSAHCINQVILATSFKRFCFIISIVSAFNILVSYLLTPPQARVSANTE